AMSDLQDRLVVLSGRSNREAWLQLQRYSDHPNFDQLLRHLERVEGALREQDIEHAVRLYVRT
ncbi:MAG TPA: hypothetical protein VFY80_10075, partial [Burkholderiales bacterium]|nr:hypothetical protein [Burkholderiales bacterium]